MNHQQITLEKLRFGLSHKVGAATLESLRIDKTEDFLTRQITYAISGFVYGRKVNESVMETTHVPLTWWDAVKERFSPAWFLRRYPARFRTINTVVHHYHTCPHLNILSDSDHLKWLSKPD
jgi:hypothetical protein